jgi:hypothetical protein
LKKIKRKDFLKVTDITNQHLEAALIDQSVAGAFNGKLYAFVAVSSNGYGLGVAVFEEQGYNPVGGKSFTTYGEAKEWADGLNAHMGLSKKAALDIVSSTMRRGVAR